MDSLGRVVTTVRGRNRHPDSFSKAAAGVHGAIAKALSTISSSLERELRMFLAKKDHKGAALHLKKRAGLLSFSTGSVLDVILRIQRSTLSHALRKEVLECVLIAANRSGSYSKVLPEVKELQRDFGKELQPEMQRALGLVRANAEAQLGRTATARALYEQLLQDRDLPAGGRAWALRGLALIGHSEPEVLRLHERAGDAFAEAGQYVEATSSYLAVAHRLINREPERAMELVDTVAKWFTEDRPVTNEQRASILHLRAAFLLDRSQHLEALRSIQEAISLREGLIGAEDTLLSSYRLAVSIARRTGDTELHSELSFKARKLAARESPEGVLRGRIAGLNASTSEADCVALRRAVKRARSPELSAELSLAEALVRPSLSFQDRIALIEAAHELASGFKSPRYRYLREHVAASFATVYHDSGRFDEAIEWYRRALVEVPGAREVRARLFRLLMSQKRPSEAAETVSEHVRFFGEQPGWLTALATALLEAGEVDKALRSLVRAGQLAPNPETAAEIQRLLDSATTSQPIAQAIHVADQISTKPPTTAKEVTAFLAHFATHVRTARRMEFWRRRKLLETERSSLRPKHRRPASHQKTRFHRWVSAPEALAKTMLWSAIAAAGTFSGAEILQEVPRGAGRIDLYVRFAEGLRVVVELKMCGYGYSRAYAQRGIRQLAHYMRSMGTSLGYLVVFDGRSDQSGNDEIGDFPDLTIRTVHIDVHPLVR